MTVNITISSIERGRDIIWISSSSHTTRFAFKGNMKDGS